MNEITQITRQNIADELILQKLPITGRLNEADFFNRIFDLKALPSYDYRKKNAYEDIHWHSNWNDYEIGWMFSDARFNLLHCSDENFIKFLRETIHPAVCPDTHISSQLIDIYNNHLIKDGFEVFIQNTVSTMPIYSIRKMHLDQALIIKKETIKSYLNSEYVKAKIKIMSETVFTDTDLALGTAKELVETACKSILKEKDIPYDKNWDLPKLFKETMNRLVCLEMAGIDNPEQAEKSLKQILGGFNSIIQGIAELRNAYGTGHGKEHDFKRLPKEYAQFLVASIADIIIFILQINGEQTEIAN